MEEGVLLRRRLAIFSVAALLVSACGAELEGPAPLIDVSALQKHIAADRDEALLVVFWATWCGPCIDEIPVLQDLYADASLNLQLLSVSLDSFLEGPEGGQALVVDFLEKTHLPWQQVVYDGGQDELFEPFRMTGMIPFSVLYDDKGNEIQRFTGRFQRGQIEASLGDAGM